MSMHLRFFPLWFGLITEAELQARCFQPEDLWYGLSEVHICVGLYAQPAASATLLPQYWIHTGIKTPFCTQTIKFKQWALADISGIAKENELP